MFFLDHWEPAALNNHLTYELGEILKNENVKLFDFYYPTYSTEQKVRFEKKFMDTYKTRQIGFETFGRFKHQLNVKLNLIMPYYVQLYGSELDVLLKKYDKDGAFNPLNNVWERTLLDETNESESQSENRYSDTPQNKLENLDHFLTSASRDNGEAKHEHKTDNLRYGNIGTMTYEQLINGFRKVFLNIDKQIIEECNDLFLGVY